MKKDTTICLMNDSFPPLIDGVANVLVNYGREIPKNGGRTVVVTPQHPDAEDSAFDFPVLRYPAIDARKSTGYMAGIPFSGELAKKLQEKQVDILHVHCPMASCFLARELREQLKAPMVLTYHTKYDIDIAKVIRSKVLQEGSIHALVENISACDEVWVVSRGAGENLVSCGYEGDYIVMPNGVDLPKGRMPEEEIAKETAGYDLPEDLPLFMFVGRLMWYKGIRISLDALAALAAEGRDFRMVIIGSGADENDIKEYVQKLQLQDKIFFTGSIRERDRIRCWYSRADLFLFPSTFDTNGLVVREASACGLASVLIEGSCAAEDVTGGRNAFLISENSESMAECLRRVGWNRNLLKETGRLASEEIYVSWSDAVKTACDRYEIVLDKYRSGDYAKHHRTADHFWQFSGDLMEGLAWAEKQRDELEEDIIARRVRMQEFRTETKAKIQTFQDETREKIQSIEGETREKIRNFPEETKERIRTFQDETKEKVQNFEGETREKMQNFQGETKEKMQNLQNETREKIRNLHEETKDLLQSSVEQYQQDMRNMYEQEFGSDSPKNS